MKDLYITQREVLIPLLKKRWMSNYEIQRAVNSSSGDRTVRRIRQFPPLGYSVLKRLKDVPEGYNRCYEYRLVRTSAGYEVSNDRTI